MSKQTAVEWLIDKLNELEFDLRLIPNHIQLAKEMEKEQIMNAHKEGFYSPPFRMSRDIESENYYEQTYGGNK
jgi:hypothetical protein